MSKMILISYLADCILAIMAIVAGVVSWFEYKSHKQKENNKLLSQLNKRYINSEDIQKVIKYIRDIDAADEKDKPTPYQTELFLRFFEELGVDLRYGSKHLVEDFKNFFNHYLIRMYETDRGKKLLEEINNEEQGTGWEYIKEYKKKVDFPYKYSLRDKSEYCKNSGNAFVYRYFRCFLYG